MSEEKLLTAHVTASIGSTFHVDFSLQFPVGTRGDEVLDLMAPILVEKILSMKLTLTQTDGTWMVSFEQEEYGTIEVEDLELEGEVLSPEDEVEEKEIKVQKLISLAAAKAIGLADYHVQVK